MTIQYKIYSLDETQPGMSLSDDLLDAHGNVLLPRGAILSEAILASLRRHQIEVVPVVVGEISDADQAVAQERHRERLARLFRRGGNNEASRLLMQYVTEYRLGA